MQACLLYLLIVLLYFMMLLSLRFLSISNIPYISKSHKCRPIDFCKTAVKPHKPSKQQGCDLSPKALTPAFECNTKQPPHQIIAFVELIAYKLTVETNTFFVKITKNKLHMTTVAV